MIGKKLRQLDSNIRNLLIWLLVLILAIWWTSFYGGTLPYTCLYAVALFPFLCIAHLAYTAASLRLFQEIPDRRIKRRERTDYTLTLENTGILPMFHLELITVDELCSMEHFEGGAPIDLAPGERRLFRADLTCLYAGTYHIGVRSYRVTDCFRMFTIEFPVYAEFRAMVQPAVSECAAPFITILNEKNNLNQPNPRVKEDQPGLDLRPYRPGDPARWIHWKNSIRMGEMLIRQPDPVDMRNLYLLPVLEAWEEEKNGRKVETLDFVRRRDAFLEQLVSAAWIFASQARPVLIYLPPDRYTQKGKEFRSYLVDSFESFEAFFQLLVDAIDQSAELTPEDYVMCRKLLHKTGDLVLELLEAEVEGGGAGWKEG